LEAINLQNATVVELTIAWFRQWFGESRAGYNGFVDGRVPAIPFAAVYLQRSFPDDVSLALMPRFIALAFASLLCARPASCCSGRYRERRRAKEVSGGEQSHEVV